MLDKIKIKDFKCFEDIEIELGNITLFSGTNSSGKSSAIQAILLIDNITKNPNSPLNSSLLNLGSFEETRNYITRSDTFSVEAYSKNDEYNFIFFKDDGKNVSFKTSKELKDEIFYLSANRLGPRNTYEKNFNSEDIVGPRGEYVIDLLNRNKTFNVQNDRIYDNSSYTLEYQVNFWLNKIVNVSLEIEDLGISNLVAVSYTHKNSTKRVRPYHIGAGTSYVIGIIILALYLNKDSILIIENPEIHLHPKAQSDLADFLCFIAKSGIQIIIESHSDHIFNGIRKSIHRKTISKDQAKIQFFKTTEMNLSQNHLIGLSEDGKILDYKEGLFDQFDNDLDILLDF
tara:strand:- start:1167 stop:2195 length:1029 start_codon:yes stop_codon:yes gene_type:complete